MRLVRLEVENFMGALGTHSLDLGQMGLLHVAGQNLDDPANNSNGAGKTTILEALTWCLFGEGLPRPQGNSNQGVRADEVLHDRLKKQCRVCAVLSDGEFMYEVRRWRKWKADKSGRQSNGQQLIINGKVSEPLDEKEANRQIVQVLGISRDIWCRGVVFGQESTFNFCDATSKQRQDILTTVMGLEQIDQWVRRCRETKSQLNLQLSRVLGRLEVLEQQDQELRDDRSAQDAQQWEKEREARRLRQSAFMKQVANDGQRLKDELAALPPEQTIEVQYFPVPEDIAVAFRAAEERLKTAQVAERVASQKIEALEQELTSESKTMNLAACPVCKQPISAEHRSECAAIAAAKTQQVLTAHEQVYADMVIAESEYKVYSDQYNQAYQLAMQQAADHKRAITEQDLMNKKRHALETRIAEFRTEWLRAKDRLQLIESEVNPHQVYQDELAGKIERVTAELAAVRAERDGINSKLATCLWWDVELPRFKTWMFDAVVDTLASEANRWLGVMSGGVLWVQISTTKYVGKQLKDELDVQIYRWNPDGSISSRPYRVWSGGEKRRVAFAVDLGLSRLLAHRASKTYEFLATDEVDRHLDSRGKDGLRKVLEELKREKETVIAVTHDPEFQASFDRELVVTKHRGRVRMEISNGRTAA